MSSFASRTEVDSFTGRPAGYLHQLIQRREFAWYMATSSLKARNAATSLGVLWWVLNPLLLSAVYFLVFGVIFSQGERGNSEYLGYLMSGMFAFQFTAGVTTKAASTIVGNARLIVNLRFPRLLLPISSILEAGIGFVAAIVVFFVVTIPLMGNWPTWSLLLLVPTLALQAVFNLGLASFAARLAVPFRDVTNLIPYLMRLWLYLSPVIWTLDLLDGAPDWVFTVMRLNPMFHILGLYRTALLGWPVDSLHWIGGSIAAVVAAAIGITAFVRFEDRMVQLL